MDSLDSYLIESIYDYIDQIPGTYQNEIGVSKEESMKNVDDLVGEVGCVYFVSSLVKKGKVKDEDYRKLMIDIISRELNKIDIGLDINDGKQKKVYIFPHEMITEAVRRIVESSKEDEFHRFCKKFYAAIKASRDICLQKAGKDPNDKENFLPPVLDVFDDPDPNSDSSNDDGSEPK